MKDMDDKMALEISDDSLISQANKGASKVVVYL